MSDPGAVNRRRRRTWLGAGLAIAGFADRMRGWRRAGGERGSSTAEAVVIVPAMMTVLLAALQIGLWAVADEAVQQVASHAALAAAVLGGSPATGEGVGEADVRSLAGPVLVDPRVMVTETGTGEVQAVATGQAESILPWLRPTVQAVRQATVQQFRSGP